MCFPSPQAPITPAPAPPAAAPLAQAVSPLTGYNNETQGQPGYSASGSPKLLRDPALGVTGAPGVGAPSGGSGLGGM